jgi:di/tricarboxylate transporter
MNVEAALVFAILAVAVLFFSTNWVRPDLVALLVLVALVIFGLVTPEEALSGFSSQAVIAIAALLIISAGLVRSGAVRWLAGRIGALAGGENRRLSLLTTAIPGFLSGFVNVIAMVSLFIPLVARLARRNEIPRSKLLLPMAVAGLVGANLTLIGASHNLVVSSLVVRWGVPRLSLFELFPVGAILLLGAILYAQLMGDRLLPDRSAETREEERRPPDHLVRTYHLEERLWELWVMPESPAVGRSLRELGVGNRYGLNVISVVGESPRRLQNGDVRLQNGDVLLVTGREERVDQLVERNEGLLFIGHPSGQDDLPFSAAQLAELVVPPRSPFIGRNLVETGFREKTGLTGVALWRGDRPIRTDVGTLPLLPGDGLLVFGSREVARSFEPEPDFLWSYPPPEEEAPQELRHLAPWSALILLAVILVTALGWMPVAVAALAGAAGVMLLGILSPQQAYENIDWRTVVLIAGMFPLGLAMEKTGAAAILSNLLVSSLGQFGPQVALVGVALLAILLTQPMHNAAVAVIMTPVAMDVAIQMGANPRAFAVAVILGASAAFLLPVGHPAALLVQQPGGYQVRDYFKFGLGLQLFYLLVIAFILPLIWPL